MGIGENIKKYRKRQGLTQKGLADKLNTTPQNLAQYENEKRNPKPETLKRIAEALNVNVQSLLPDTVYNHILGDKAAIAYDTILDQIMGLSGYAFGITEDTDSLYISYPDGILKISSDTADKLQDDILSYVNFKIQQLKKEHLDDFVPKKYFDYSSKTIKPEYQKNFTDRDEKSELLAAHARTDVEQTPEGVQHDLDIMSNDSEWD